jgi:hypothetical protein
MEIYSLHLSKVLPLLHLGKEKDLEDGIYDPDNIATIIVPCVVRKALLWSTHVQVVFFIHLIKTTETQRHNVTQSYCDSPCHRSPWFNHIK